MLRKCAILTSLFLSFFAKAQPPEDKSYTAFHLSGTYYFSLGGYVYVKEAALPADTLSFSQYFKSSYLSSVSASVTHTFKNRGSVSLSGENFFFTGTNRPKKIIYHNNLVIDGYHSISVDRSQLFRVQLQYMKPLTNVSSDFQFYYRAGLLYDYLIFQIDASVLNENPDLVNLEEDFNDQVIPYPFLGMRAELYLNKSRNSIIYAEGLGTFIPASTGFFRSPHAKDYSYYTVNASGGYEYRSGRLSVSPKLTYLILHTTEDEHFHRYKLSTTGVSLDIGWRFN
jgi:hypothetical protein